MWYVGIDPGKQGAVAVINEFRQGLVLPMPDGERAIRDFFFNLADEYALKERPTTTSIWGMEIEHSFPFVDKKTKKVVRGATATWTFAQHYGYLRGLLTALDIAYEEVSVHEWMKECRVPPRGTNYGRKPGLFRAKLWFPHLKPTNNNADAILIAEFLRRRKCVYDVYASEVDPLTALTSTSSQKEPTAESSKG